MTLTFPEYDQIVKSVVRADALLAGQRKALELLAKRAPLVEVLHHLIAVLEEQYDGLLCSIMLVDEKTQTFKAGVDVSDAKNYSMEISGVSILPPYVGPCCKAANLGELVVSEDIATDNSWQDKWKNWAITNGLKSCRSHPIFSSTGKVIGTFALYHKKHSDPVLANMYQVELTTHIAGIAIERRLIETYETEWRERLEQINQELLHALRMRDESLSITSHELNSPLATLKMRMALEKELLLEGGADQTSTVQLLEYYESQIDKVLSLVRILMDSASVSSGRQELRPTPFDLNGLISEVVEKLNPMARKAKCSFQVDLVDSTWGTWDQIRLEQVFTNLVTNAIKYGGNGVIRIAKQNVGNRIQLTIQDCGPGIALEDHERIFQRYERLRASKSSTPGLGLGLFIVREIVAAHGGHVYVESELGQGSKFIVELPYQSPTKMNREQSLH